MNSLTIPLKQRLKGQTVACTICYAKGKGFCSSKAKNGTTQWVCKESGASISKCERKPSHRFLSCLYNPFTQRPDIYIWHQTRDYHEYRQAHLKLLEIETEYKQLYKAGDFTQAEIIINSLKPTPSQSRSGQNTHDAQSREIHLTPRTQIRSAALTYAAFLYGEKGGKHDRRPKNKKYINRCIDILERFINCLDRNGHNTHLITLGSLNKFQLECWIDEVKDSEIAGKTKNDYLNTISTFLKWCSKRGRITVCDHLDHIERDATEGDTTVIEPHEFEAMMELVTPEHSIEETFEKHRGKVKPRKRNHYRDWMQDALWLSLLLGGRGDDITEFKWSDVKTRTNRNGDTSYWIELFDHKFFRQHNKKQYIHIPIFKKTYDILLRLGLEDKLGTNEFVISPETENRDTVKRVMSRAFLWYWRLYAPDSERKVSFKSLRSTFVTIATIITGDQFEMVQKHTNRDTANKHYMKKSLAVSQMFGMDFDLG